MNNTTTAGRSLKALRRTVFILGAMGAQTAAAAPADLSTEPLTNSSSASIRPNVMFVLDDSGSMGFDFAPDRVGLYKYTSVLIPNASEKADAHTKVCFGVAAVNPTFYDPALTYKPPVQPNGTPYPDAAFDAAWRDGFDTSAGTRDLRTVGNLSSPRTQIGAISGAAVYSRFYYATWNRTGKPQCGDSRSASPPSFPGTYDYRNFNIVTDASAWSAAQKTNYANWYSYYRTRMLAMRSASGRVFATINPSRFRVGFSTINDTRATDSSSFLNIRDFDAADQRDTFFSNLYGTAARGGTPLRAALSKAGRYYAGKLSGQEDPVQYSCQRNYTILSSDGYWNDSNSAAVKLDGTTRVGNQDAGSTPRPQLDDIADNGRPGGAGKADTLSDVAMYYYKTDLRTDALGNCTVRRDGLDVNVCTNNVGRTASDPADWQHMNTITLGLGVPGTLAYDPNYEFQTSGDFFEIKNGTKAWPDPMPFANATTGQRIDDLWHAAVNGRGRYYSADNPSSLATSLTGALNSIESSKGSGTSASASNLRPVAGDNAIFIASYYSGSWDGDVKAQSVDPTTGIIDPAVLWSARVQVTGQSASSRSLYFFDDASASRLSPFTYVNLTAAGKNGNFDGMCPVTGDIRLSQCLTLSTAERTLLTGERLVNFLRGDGSFEASPGAASPLFRYRYNEKEGYRNVLGDIVNAAPVYVKKPKFRYLDSGYAEFANAATSVNRKGVVYAGANDGMLHAFDAATGAELWGYIPSMVLPKLHKLADLNYATRHDYFVDAAPAAGDVRDASGTWRTILVGGLGNGGRGYYALDVTNPDNPKALWEYTEADLGATFGNPVITKINNGGDGRWAVIFSSGYNNVSGGNGQSYLYVLDAVTGALIRKVGTGVGSTTTPSNLGRINNWVDDETDNLTETVYGGDLLGNVWRFDIGDASASNWRAVLLGKTESAGAEVQSITVKPELTEINVGGVKYRLVSVGTGRYLGSSDVASTVVQSVYVFKDPLATTGLGVLRSVPNMVKQTLSDFTTSTGVVARTLADPKAVDWSTDAGWFVDFSLTGGERVDIEMRQQLTRLNVVTNAPDPNACSSGGAGGTSWLYYFDIVTGSYVATAQDGLLLASKVDDTTTAGQEVIQLADGSLKTIVCSRDGECMTLDDPPAPASAVGLRRISWRELIN